MAAGDAHVLSPPLLLAGDRPITGLEGNLETRSALLTATLLAAGAPAAAASAGGTAAAAAAGVLLAELAALGDGAALVAEHCTDNAAAGLAATAAAAGACPSPGVGEMAGDKPGEKLGLGAHHCTTDSQASVVLRLANGAPASSGLCCGTTDTACNGLAVVPPKDTLGMRLGTLAAASHAVPPVTAACTLPPAFAVLTGSRRFVPADLDVVVLSMPLSDAPVCGLCCCCCGCRPAGAAPPGESAVFVTDSDRMLLLTLALRWKGLLSLLLLYLPQLVSKSCN